MTEQGQRFTFDDAYRALREHIGHQVQITCHPDAQGLRSGLAGILWAVAEEDAAGFHVRVQVGRDPGNYIGLDPRSFLGGHWLENPAGSFESRRMTRPTGRRCQPRSSSLRSASPYLNLVLFLWFTDIIAWGPTGKAWETHTTIADDLEVTYIMGSQLHMTGSDPPGSTRSFTVDLTTGTTTAGPVVSSDPDRT